MRKNRSRSTARRGAMASSSPRISPLLRSVLRECRQEPSFRNMKALRAHGRVNLYQHSLRVAARAERLDHLLRLKCDRRSLLRGSLLHDYYQYDWHDHHPARLRDIHGLSHPSTALRCADEDFDLNETERDIILNHMWPLTLFSFPRSREARLVCLADKLCSLEETLFFR